jgi:hypothetical protein
MVALSVRVSFKRTSDDATSDKRQIRGAPNTFDVSADIMTLFPQHSRILNQSPSLAPAPASP